MARTALTPITTNNPWDTGGTLLTLTALDQANGNSFPATGRECIFAQNTDAGSQTITIRSTADAEGRTGDAAKAMAASSFAVFQMFPTKGWIQSDGNIYIDTTSANIKVAVVRFP